MYETEILEDALGRVRAPEELWDRIERGRARKTRPSNRAQKLAWSVAAAVVFAGIAWNLPRPEFRSDDPVAIRAWVQEHSGIDLPLAHSGAVRLESVRLEREGVEVAFRTQGRRAAFSVSKASPGATAHWSVGARGYVLACATPGDLDLSCGLCHI